MTTSTEVKPLPHKERLLRHGTRLFYANGYHGTTVDAVLESSHVPKGSFYHHFGSKEAFGLAVLDRYMEFQIDMFDTFAAKPGLSTTEKIVGYFRQISDLFINSNYERACLAGKFSTEIAASSQAFRDRLDVQVRAWKERIVELLAEGQRAGDVRTDRSAQQLGDAVLSLIQGSLVIVLSTRDLDTLEATAATLEVVIAPPA